MGHYYFQKIGISVILLTLLFLPFIGSAQVGIGTTTPDSNALLELDASTTVGGFLMPRVALTATDNPSPLSGIITPGMTVYNTATAGSGANVVTPGFYYHDGTIWIRVGSDADAKNNWSLTGNSGTNPTDHFLGTKDAQPLLDRKSTRLNSSHVRISYAVFCLKKKKHKLHVSQLMLT